VADSSVLSVNLLLFGDNSCCVRSQAVVEALKKKQSLTNITAGDFDPATKKAWFKLLQVFWKVLRIWPVSSGRLYCFSDPSTLSHVRSLAGVCSMKLSYRIGIFTDLFSFFPFLQCRKCCPDLFAK
jgi:hypothetical protein